jgi:hypothetical protein
MIKLMKEHGRDVRLDAAAEAKLVQASLRCKWRPRTKELFPDIVTLMRDTGMRNERELFRMRIENLDWSNQTIFVPDSKTQSADFWNSKKSGLLQPKLD